jgi:hypothetical protein
LAVETAERTSALLGRRDECDALDRLLADALEGESRVMVLRGEAGVGKSALLGHLSERVAGWHVARAEGVESEMELAYSGLHQLCAPMLEHLERLPVPQREALAIVFGRSAGPVPDRFLVAIATLTLLADVAEQQPLACIVDDAHWLDQASVQIIGFVGRRLLAERIALVCAVRTGIGDDVLVGLPELFVGGLGERDARATGSSPRAAAIPSRCSSCHVTPRSRIWPSMSARRTRRRWRTRSRRPTRGASTHSLMRHGYSCSPQRQSRSVIQCCSTVRSQRSKST